MGLLRKAAYGLGKGLEKAGEHEWKRLKVESDRAAQRALIELEQKNRLEVQGIADRNADARDERRIAAGAAEGQAERASREKISSDDNKAQLAAAQARGAGRGGVGVDTDGDGVIDSYTGGGDGDFRNANEQILVEKIARDKDGQPVKDKDGKLVMEPVLDAEGKPQYQSKLRIYSGKTGRDRENDDSVEVDDSILGRLTQPPPQASPAPAVGSGVLSQASQVSQPSVPSQAAAPAVTPQAATPRPKGVITDPVRDSVALDARINGITQALQSNADPQAADALQRQLSVLITQKNQMKAARGY